METGMGHTLGDAYIVAALAAAFVAWLFIRHVERQRRLEIVHKERLIAMDKGIPLPELPLDVATGRTPPDPRAPLLHGIVWTALGIGGIAALLLFGKLPSYGGHEIWPLPIPLLFLGIGLILYYVLASRRAR